MAEIDNEKSREMEVIQQEHYRQMMMKDQDF